MSFNPWPVGITVFFVVIVGVNAALVTLATRGYGGMLDQHPYQKGLEYDLRKEQLEAYRASGLRATLRTSPVRIEISDSSDSLVNDANITIRAIRPNSASADRQWLLPRQSPGVYGVEETLARGQWLIDITLERGGNIYRIDGSIFADAGRDIPL